MYIIHEPRPTAKQIFVSLAEGRLASTAPILATVERWRTLQLYLHIDLVYLLVFQAEGKPIHRNIEELA
jgi:hypothetical protein